MSKPLVSNAIGAINAAPPPLVPINIVPEPAITGLPWLPTVPSTVAGLPLISTVGITALARALPQPVGSPMRAAGRLSNSTSGEPATIGLGPWPGIGQAVGSLTRAAGLPDMGSP